MISIIIPAHQEKENLTDLIGELSGLKSDHGFEIIVALSPESKNDFSVDVCNKAQLIMCSQKGRAVQMNEASRVAKGEIVAFLHADVRPPASFLMDIESAIANGNDAGFFSYKFDKDSFLLNINAFFTRKDGFFTGGGDQCLFIKKTVFNTLGGFNETQIIMEDFEFFKRMKQQRVPYTIIGNNLVVSARKYESNSYLKVNLSNLLLMVLFKMGVSGKKLKRLHDSLLKTPYST
ncbi:TIGR04283 family arsenosugar biosynthesis glycosyltransferase [Maribacter thermophilus]|uniref:TIGR04283 family arsenosugar biosynthesis glycosyltransferase n=1 Tax=Maribacter thermophilus TaxID=1197874 RepID=UPI000641281D|nr:TIGR04283 family arsenosugar biosynthesis glycosyltransferase [Maribacter thermophilus]